MAHLDANERQYGPTVAIPCSSSCLSIRSEQHSQRLAKIDVWKDLRAVAVHRMIHGARERTLPSCERSIMWP